MGECKQMCHKIQYKITGLKRGDESRCGDSNNGIGRSVIFLVVGIKSITCGGALRMNVFGPVEDLDAPPKAGTATNFVWDERRDRGTDEYCWRDCGCDCDF